jgi:hypothetical protein
MDLQVKYVAHDTLLAHAAHTVLVSSLDTVVPMDL